MKNQIFSISFLLIAILLVASCDKDNNHPGYQYYPDMIDSRAYESYSSNPNFDDNSTLREPVEGTVPRGHQPFEYGVSMDEKERAGKELVNPFAVNEAVLARGKDRFTIYCAGCHGDFGDGKGHLFTSGRYPFPPATLISDQVQAYPDGYIFHTITLGKGVMGAHGTMIPEDDRWKIVHYIKTELGN